MFVHEKHNENATIEEVKPKRTDFENFPKAVNPGAVVNKENVRFHILIKIR